MDCQIVCGKTRKIGIGVNTLTINALADLLLTLNGEGQVFLNEPMKKHTSFKIGGPADLLVMPHGVASLSKTLSLISQSGLPFFVMGNGSNLLVSDQGYRGVIVKVAENLQDFAIEGEEVVAEAGVLLSGLSKAIMAAELTGFEFASGIPGTIGGALFMNAGAYDGEMKDVVSWVEVLTLNGDLKRYEAEDMAFGYRTSLLHENGEVAVRCGLCLKKGKYEDIKAKTDDLTLKRTTKQPLWLPSAGSTFKRPPGYFAGKLIDDSGLRGLRHGGAQISDLHSGFVVNIDNATCQDVRELIAVVQKVVRDQFGVTLETEVRLLGEF